MFPTRLPLVKDVLLTCLQNGIDDFSVSEAEEGGPAVQNEEIKPAAEGDGGKLARGVQLALVPRVRAFGSHAVLLETQHLHTRGPVCRGRELCQSGRTSIRATSVSG